MAERTELLGEIILGDIKDSSARVKSIGDSMLHGLNVVQNLGIQTANAAFVQGTSQANDAEAMAGLRTAVYVPEKTH